MVSLLWQAPGLRKSLTYLSMTDSFPVCVLIVNRQMIVVQIYGVQDDISIYEYDVE